MSTNFYDTVKNKINSFFKGKSPKYTETQKDIEENSVLLRKFEGRKSLSINKKPNTDDSSLNIRLLPSLYFGVNLSLIFILLILKFNNNVIFEDDLVTKEVILPDFFDLYKVNNLVFHCYEIVLSILGFLITFFVYNLFYNIFVEQKMNSFKYMYKLHLMLIFGMISNIFLLIISFTPSLNDLNINQDFLIETKIKLDQFIFIIHIFFSILFYTFSLCCLKMTSVSNVDSKKKWLSFKLVILIYLLVLSFFYVIVLVFKNKFIK